MPGYLLHSGATVNCSHGGQATPTALNPRVTLSNQPSVVLSASWVVAGCPLASTASPFCAIAQWVTGSTRVTSLGQPLMVYDGQAVCIPTGTPLVPVESQTRVTAL